MFVGVPTANAAEEHCLVVQAMALTGYNERMELLVGTDDIFTAALYAQQVASKKVNEKYHALIAARNKRGSDENPENRMSSFGSPAERTGTGSRPKKRNSRVFRCIYASYGS